AQSAWTARAVTGRNRGDMTRNRATPETQPRRKWVMPATRNIPLPEVLADDSARPPQHDHVPCTPFCDDVVAMLEHAHESFNLIQRDHSADFAVPELGIAQHDLGVVAPVELGDEVAQR